MPEQIGQFRPLRHWVADDGGHAFQTFSSAEWFIRRHRPELVESGQLILRKGSAGSLVGPQFGEKVLEILRRESRRALAGEGA